MLFRDHKICRKLLTPIRDHLLFPNDDGKREQHPAKLNVMSMKSKAYGIITDQDKVGKLSKGKTGNSINKNEKNLTGKVSKLNFSASMLFPKNDDISKSSSSQNPSLKKEIKLPQITVKQMSTSIMKRIPEETAAEYVRTGSAATSRTAGIKNR